MADVKISQLTAKGSKVASTDRIMISEDVGGGTFTSKYVTGSEVNKLSLDTTPQLGGNLDVNGSKITSASNGNVIIEPNGTGALVIGGNSTAATTVRFMEDSDNGTNFIGLKAPDNLAASSVFVLPNADGTNGQALVTDGSRNLSWATAGGVTNVSALTLGTTGTDLSSTVANGTTTPVITLNVPTASASNRGALSSTDWSTFNNKQAALVSGTNIKTIEGQSILGSGNIDITKSDVGLGNVDNTSDLNKPISTATQTALNAKQDTLVSGTNIKTINSTSLLGSGDITTPVGIHAPLIPASGGFINPLMVTYQAIATTLSSANLLRCFPFIPMKSFTIVSYSINVTAAVASSNMRVLFYDNLNGLPNAKLYESANIDTSTTGIKTVTQAYTFNAGTTYWLCVQTSAAITLSSHSFNGGYAWQQVGASFNLSNNVSYTYAIGSAPATLTTTGATYPTNNLVHLIFNL